MSHTCDRDGCNNSAKSRYCSHACANAEIARRKREGVSAAPAGRQTLSRVVSESGGSRELTIPVDHEITNEQEMLKVCKIDTQVWEVERWVCNTWTGHMAPRVVGRSNAWVRESAAPVKTRQWQVKVWLRRKDAVIAARNELAELKKLAKETRLWRAPAVRHATQPGLLLEINIADLHVGKLAWAGETGDANYDSRIAERLHDDALATFLKRAGVPGTPFERILLVVGNDLLHSDTKAGTTTKGTPLDNDGRYHKTFARTRTMIVRAVTQLRQIAPVTVMVVPGNHDTLSTWHLGDSLEAFFHADPNVEVRNEPTPRKYFQHGDVMLMFTHGDKGKFTDYPLVMATEQPTMWAATRFREIHTGDKHQEKLIENRGVKARILPSLSAPDAWHNEQFFTGNLRQAQAFIWSRTEGLVGTLYYTVPREVVSDGTETGGSRVVGAAEFERRRVERAERSGDRYPPTSGAGAADGPGASQGRARRRQSRTPLAHGRAA